jgi:hypothetical protein
MTRRSTDAKFAAAAAAGGRGDFKEAEDLYEDLWARTAAPYFRVRALESRRLRGVPSGELTALGEVTVDDIVGSLSMEFAEHLIARKLALGTATLRDVPPQLQSSRVILDGVGKWWESTGVVDVAGSHGLAFQALPKVGISVQASATLHEPSRLIVLPLDILYAESPVDPTLLSSGEIPRLAGGWSELTDVFAACDSNTFVGREQAFVDEYRSEFPQEADPRTDPLALGIRDSFVLGIGPQSLGQLATSQHLDGFWLAGRFANEWGHWFTNHLTRIQYLRLHPLWGQRPLYIRAGLPKAFVEFLDLLAPGIELVEMAAGEIAHFERLVLSPARTFGPPNPRRALTGVPSHSFAEPEQIASLSHDLEAIAVQLGCSHGPKKVLASRGSYSRRFLKQREVMTRELLDLGFQEVDFGTQSVREQLGVWLTAETLVGESGSWLYAAGLAPTARIVVLNSELARAWHPDVSSLNTGRKSPIGVILGREVDPDSRDQTEGRSHLPWTLSPNALDALVRILESR